MICYDICFNYIEFIQEKLRKDKDLYLTRFDFEDLLRVSICKTLGLETTEGSEVVQSLTKECSKRIFKRIKYKRWSRDYSQGVLEACIKVLRASIDSSEVKKNDRVSI